MFHRTIITILLLSFAAPVHAGEKNGEALARAKALFRQGGTLYRLGKFNEALAKFEAAFKHAQRPSIVMNMAQCHRNLNNHRRALFYYKLYLSDWKRTQPGKPPPYEGEVKAHIARLRAKLSKGDQLQPGKQTRFALLWIQGILVARAQVLVDDVHRAVSPLSRPISVAPGKHVVRVEAPGHFPWRKAIEVSPGQEQRVLVALVPTTRKRRTFWLVATLTTLALAAGAEAVGIAYNLDANSQFEYTSSFVEARGVSIAGHVTAGVCLGLSVASLVLYLRSGRVERPNTPSATIMPLRGGAAAVWRVRF